MSRNDGASGIEAAAEGRHLVFLDYDQAQLDNAYDQAKSAPNIKQVLQRLASNSEITRRRLGEPQRFAYGAAPIEMLDLYRCKNKSAPTFIFVHGGAWRSGTAKDNAFLVEGFNAAGVNVALLDFSCVQDVGGDLMTVTDQVSRGLAWIYHNASQMGIAANRLYAGGHSSGAQLLSACLIKDWQLDFKIPQTFIKGALLSSGMYDLKPVRLSARSAYVKIDDRAEMVLSAQRHLDKIAAPLIIAYGSYESPEFKRHALDFHAALQAAGKPVSLICAEHYNHFEISETLANPVGLLGRAVLNMINTIESTAK